MHRRFFVVILLVTFLSAISFAQDEPKEGKVGTEAIYRIAVAGSGGFLGVELDEVSKSNYQELGLMEVRGAAVVRVIKDSAAEKAGIAKGDVIVRFNGDEVTSTRKLTRMIGEVAPDHTVTLTVVRGGAELDIPVTMGERKGLAYIGRDFEFPTPPLPPSRPDGPMLPTTPRAIPAPPLPPSARVYPGPGEMSDMKVFGLVSGRTIGVGVTSLTKQLGEHFGVADGKGVLVNDVRKDSPAERAGLRAGDVIIAIDGKDIGSQMDLMRGLSGEKKGDVVLTIVRNRNRQQVTVTPEEGRGNIRFEGYEFKTREKESN